VALSLISRPIGNKLSTTQVEGTIYDNGAGDAVVYVPGGHSLSDGDYVYIDSDSESYAGFKYVDATSYDYFKIKDSEGGEFIPFFTEQEIVLYPSILTHGWQAVHNPIVYELQSDIYPINQAEEEYNPNTVDSFANYGGNTQLNLDNALSDPTALTYIELVGEGELAGVYQIITALQPWSVVIDLAYDATNDFTGYTVVKYYNNYHITVEVWAGLESGHRWEALKPFELAAELKLIPDSTGKAKFSIHEILRGYVTTRNNLTLDTLPNNLDFHTAFYIKYYESYDTSTGTVISTFDGETTDDSENFIGHAVNASMPFKSQNESFLSDYIGSVDLPARWLTMFDRPVAVIGYFFDLSLIFPQMGTDIDVVIEKSFEGVTTETETLTIENTGNGIIRVPFTPETGFDQYCLKAYAAAGTQSVSLTSWVNAPGSNEDWTLGATPSVTVAFPLPPQSSNVIYGSYSFMAGVEYTVELDYSAGIGNSTIRILNDSLTTLFSESQSLLIGGTASITFTATSATTKIGFSVTGNGTITLSNLRVTTTSYQVTEQICIDIIEECGSTYTNDNLRITESTILRRIE
jgi:hypothetical protein